MQEGSIVIMVKPLDKKAIALLSQNGITKYPTPGDTTHTITNMRCIKKYTCISLDTYPEYAQVNIYFVVDLFKEIMPPDNIAQALMKQVEDYEFTKQFY